MFRLPAIAVLQLLGLALVLSACGSSDAERKADGEATAIWADTGSEAAPGDATWEAEDPLEDADNGQAADAGYDGLRPMHPEVEDADEDSSYRAGESVLVAFDLENTGEEDYLHHPGLVLTCDHPDVEIPEDAQWVESLLAGEHSEMSWWAVVGPTVESGDEVRFTATVSARGCEDSDEGCPVAHTASITVRVD